MKKLKYFVLVLIGLYGASSCVNIDSSNEEEKVSEETDTSKETTSDVSNTDNICETSSLGAFSISLSVKDLQVSREFYEKLGFIQMGGGEEMNYLIMSNGRTIIGLFQGMFEGNILTFNPGLNENNKPLEKYDDIRVIQENLLKAGISLQDTLDPNSSGPGSLFFTDPDGNLILIDQFQ